MPAELDGGWCVLRPLCTADNDRDFAAWHGSIEHIRATPGYTHRTDWPVEDYDLARNEADLAGHEADFAAGTGFTYTVLTPDRSEVIGCVYVYPPAPEDHEHDVDVRSWVRADHAERDADLHGLVTRWLADEWPFTAVRYAPR